MVRNKLSDRYYARLYRSGKEKWTSLETANYSVAKAKLADLQKQHREHPVAEFNSGDAKMNFAAAAKRHLLNVEQDVSIKGATKTYAKELHAAILKNWPELDEKEIRRITPEACLEWASRFAKNYGATRYNAAVSFMRNVFKVAIKAGVIHANPATELNRKRVKGKMLELPSLAKFAQFIAQMRHGHGRFSKDCADLAEGRGLAKNTAQLHTLFALANLVLAKRTLLNATAT